MACCCVWGCGFHSTLEGQSSVSASVTNSTPAQLPGPVWYTLPLLPQNTASTVWLIHCSGTKDLAYGTLSFPEKLFQEGLHLEKISGRQLILILRLPADHTWLWGVDPYQPVEQEKLETLA